VSEVESFDFILDAWAVLAHLENGPGAERIREVLKSAANDECTLGMSLINLGEVAYITERERGITWVHDVLATLRALPVTMVPADESVVLTAAHIKANHRLSYADAFAAATARLWKGVLLTGDPEFEVLAGDEIVVEWLSS